MFNFLFSILDIFVIEKLDISDCPILEPGQSQFIKNRISILMYLEAGLVLACFAAILIHFPAKPKHPPSISSAQERMDFLPGLKSIVTNHKAIMLTLAYR